MRERTVRMYYCGFCKKKGQVRAVMEKHETRCTRNPLRQCGVCDMQYDANTVAELTAAAMQGMDALRDRCEACPVCMVIGINAALAVYYKESAERFELDAFSEMSAKEPEPPAPAWVEPAQKFNLKDALAEWWSDRNAEMNRVYHV